MKLLAQLPALSHTPASGVGFCTHIPSGQDMTSTGGDDPPPQLAIVPLVAAMVPAPSTVNARIAGMRSRSLMAQL